MFWIYLKDFRDGLLCLHIIFDTIVIGPKRKKKAVSGKNGSICPLTDRLESEYIWSKIFSSSEFLIFWTRYLTIIKSHLMKKSSFLPGMCPHTMEQQCAHPPCDRS